MDPASIWLLMSLLVATGGVADATNDRAHRATHGSMGAARAAVSSGRSTGATVFSRPPSRSPGHTSSLGADSKWFLGQLWGALRVGWSALGALRSGYRTGATAATERRAARRQKKLARSGAYEREMVTDDGTIVLVDDGPPEGVEVVPPANLMTRFTDWRQRLGDRINNRIMDVTERLNRPIGPVTIPWPRRRREEATDVAETQESTDAPPQPDTTESRPAQPRRRNGAAMSTMTTDIPAVEVGEIVSPSSLEPPLEDLGHLTEHIARAMDALTTGITEFVNGYAEAKFSTEALTETIGAMVETIDSDGHVNLVAFAESLPPIAEAIEEAKTLGESASQVRAEGDVEAFKES